MIDYPSSTLVVLLLVLSIISAQASVCFITTKECTHVTSCCYQWTTLFKSDTELQLSAKIYILQENLLIANKKLQISLLQAMGLY